MKSNYLIFIPIPVPLHILSISTFPLVMVSIVGFVSAKVNVFWPAAIAPVLVPKPSIVWSAPYTFSTVASPEEY